MIYACVPHIMHKIVATFFDFRLQQAMLTTGNN